MQKSQKGEVYDACMETRESFMQLFDGYSDEVFKICLYRGHNRERAVYLTQEVFAQSWELITKGAPVSRTTCEKVLDKLVAGPQLSTFSHTNRRLQFSS